MTIIFGTAVPVFTTEAVIAVAAACAVLRPLRAGLNDNWVLPAGGDGRAAIDDV